jgi:hypothetical protein
MLSKEMFKVFLETGKIDEQLFHLLLQYSSNTKSSKPFIVAMMVVCLMLLSNEARDPSMTLGSK